jgi:SAM-dependent methyltransferase
MGWEQARLDELTADVFGFKALQVGFPQIDALRANRMQHRWLSDVKSQYETPPDEESYRRIAVVHDFAELPFATQSLDLVVLPHVLEFATEPHQVLREVERVLRPEGQVIISGFNPASLWGLRQGFGAVTGAHFLPEYAEFITLHRLKDWLKLLSFEVNRGHFGCYLPPTRSEKWMKRYAFLEKVGERWWPYLGAVYIVQAVKRVRGMTMLDQPRSRRAPRIGATVSIVNKAPQAQAAKPTGNEK